MGLSKMIKASKSNLLVTPIQEEFLLRTSNVELSDEVTAWLAREVQAKQRDRTKTWSSSSLGACQRQHIYKYLGVKPEKGINSDLASIFIHGTWTHLKWQAMGYMAGWMGETEVPCSIPELGFTGTIDGVLDPAVVGVEAGWELKSINARGFKFVLSDGPKEMHLRQIHGYMLATGLRLWSLIYEEKDTQQYKEFVVEFDESIALSVQLELEALNTAVKQRTLPPMLPGCVAKTSATYRQCQFRETCEAGSWPQKRLSIRRSPSSTPSSTGATP